MSEPLSLEPLLLEAIEAGRAREALGLVDGLAGDDDTLAGGDGADAISPELRDFLAQHPDAPEDRRNYLIQNPQLPASMWPHMIQPVPGSSPLFTPGAEEGGTPPATPAAPAAPAAPAGRNALRPIAPLPGRTPPAPKVPQVPGLPAPKPKLPPEPTDSDIARFTQDTIDWVGADAFYRLSLQEVAEVLETSERVDLAAAREWGDMSPVDREAAIARYAVDPFMSLADALKPEGFDAELRGADPAPAAGAISPELQRFLDENPDAPEDRRQYLIDNPQLPASMWPFMIQPVPEGSREFTPGGGEGAAPADAPEGLDEARAREFRDLPPEDQERIRQGLDEGLPVDELFAPEGLDGRALLRDTLEGGEGEDTLAAGPGIVRRVGGDMLTGLGESGVQVIGGVRDAAFAALTGLAEFDEWASDALGLPRLQIMDENWEFNPDLTWPDENTVAEVRLPEVRQPRSVTGGFVRGVGQFLAGFAAGGPVVRALGVSAGGGAAAAGGRAMLRSMFSDFVAFDGHEARLSDLVESVPALQNPVTDYLKSDAEDGELEGRIKNVLEGVATDQIVTGVLAGLRAVRVARKLRDGTGAETYAEAQRRLARETNFDRNAPDLPEFRAPDTPALVDRKPPSMLGREDPEAVAGEIQTYLDGLGLKASTPEADPLAEALGQLRQKVTQTAIEAGAPKGALKRPVARILRGLGGVDPSGALAAELRARGITPTSFPGLFRRGGLTDADNIPLSEHPVIQSRIQDDGTGYVPVQAWVDGLEDEMLGRPWRDAAEQSDALDLGELGALADDLDRMGIDWANMTDDQVRAALDEEMRLSLDMQGLDKLDESDPRELIDLDRELAERAAAGDPHVSAVPGDGGDVYINWARIDSGDDVRALIQMMADKAKGEVDEARRGVRTNVQTARAADMENAWQLLVERRPGEALNAEKSLALRRLWTASGEKLADAARRMSKAPTPTNAYLMRRAMALHGAIQREVISVRTETARALQQWKMPAGSNGLMLDQIEDAIRRHGDVGVSRELADRLAALADAGDRGAFDEMARKSPLAASFDAVTEYWTMGILSGPKTHLVNAMSNTGVILGNIVERAAGAKLGQLRGTIDPVEAAEAGAMVQGLVGALPDAWRFAVKAARTGQSGFGLGKVELPYTRAISTEALGNTTSRRFNDAVNLPVISHGINAFGALMSTPGRALVSADEFFKTINMRMEVQAQAVRQANRELRAGGIRPEDLRGRIADLVLEPAEDTLRKAREFAQYSTFTNDAGRYANAVAKLRHDAPLLRFVVPFLNTPANILRFAAERSPIAPLLADVRADIRAGGARADMALTKLGIGSFTMLTAFDMALNGQITGSGPSHANSQALLRRTGWMPNAIRIGNRWVAYSRMDPYGTLFGVAANLAEMALNSDIDPGEDVDEAVYGAIGAIGETLMDKTYLTGLADIFTAMAEPKRFFPRYMENLAGSFVPAAVREVKGVMDPRMTRVTDTLEAVKSRLPVFSEEVEGRHDLWGRQITFSSGLGKGYDAVSPIYSSSMKPEPIDLELLEIGYAPGLPSQTIQISGERFVLRNQPRAYERYVVLQGATKASEFPPVLKVNGEPNAASARMQAYGDRTLLETLNAIVSGEHELSEDYLSLDAEGRIKAVGQVIEDYRFFARIRLQEEFPEIFTPGSGRRKGTASPFGIFVEPRP